MFFILAYHSRKVLLRRIYIAWFGHTCYQRSKEQEMVMKFFRSFSLRRKFIAWRNYMVHEKVKSAKKNMYAASLGDRSVERRTLQRWKRAAELQKAERRLEIEVAEKWLEVREWLKNCESSHEMM